MIMSSGEHIIGEMLDQDDEGNVTMETPVSMVPDPNPQRRGSMMFMPYLQFTNSKEAVFPAKDIRHVLTDIRDDLKRAYDQQFGVGLAVPPEKNIILG
jgi:hypothetical protein